MNKKNSRFLENLFLEIKDGYSIFEYQKNTVFIKHASLDELKIQNNYYQKFFDKARKMGVPDEEELLHTLQESKVWTSSEESEYESLKSEIQNLDKTISKLFTESERKPLEIRLAEAKKDYKKIRKKREGLFTSSAENYADRKSNEAFVRHCFFKNKNLDTFLYSQEEFEEIDNLELSTLYEAYNEHAKNFSELNIKKISINPTFKSIFNLFSKDISNFFNKHPFELSFYQINLLNYGKLFDAIFKNNKIPKHISEDPEKILNFIEEDEKKSKKNIDEKIQSADGFSYAGAKAKDMENMGINKKGSKDIHEVAKEHGGELSMEDFMKIHKK